MNEASKNTCELCRREVTEKTEHHLIPRTRHKNKRNKKEFSRKEVKERTAYLCRPCHNIIHATLTEKQLEREYNTLDRLHDHPEIAKFVDWISDKPDGFTAPRSRSVGGRRARGRR
ncbi:MAG: hypothetical protein GY854_25380 [Deltaproteobacteria bacterium]|nr:hypothetical protein [Deltaproteobacteria bacterium]